MTALSRQLPPKTIGIISLDQRSANFFYKGPNSKYCKFLVWKVSTKMAQLCHCSAKAAIGYT